MHRPAKALHGSGPAETLSGYAPPGTIPGRGPRGMLSVLLRAARRPGRFLRFPAGRGFPRVPAHTFPVLLAHIIDFNSGEGTVGKPLLDRQSGIVRMNMDLHHAAVRYQHDGIPQRFQVRLKGRFLLIRVLFFEIDDEFGAVPETDIGGLRRRSVRPHGDRYGDPDRAVRLAAVLHGKIRHLAGKAVQSPLHHLHEPLAAGIHHARLLQDGKHLRRLAQHKIAVFDDFLRELDNILRLLRQFHGPVRHAAGHREDRAFLWLHDGLIGGLRAAYERVCQRADRDCLFRFDFFGKSSEQLGQDNTGIPPGAPQGTGGNRLGQRFHRRFVKGRHLPGRRHDRHGHVGAGIAVRHRKNIQFIDPFFICLKPLGSREKCLPEGFRVHHFHTHR